MPPTTTTTFDLAALRRAVEARDADAQVALYHDDAEIELVDRDHPPSRPLVLRGTGEIAAHLADICARDMTHHVEHAVSDGSSAAFGVRCDYPDGTRVLCAALVDLREERIARQVIVQAWDVETGGAQPPRTL